MTFRSARRSRIAHFKAPFIVSVAAPAAFGMACGGQTNMMAGSGGTMALLASGGGAGSSSTSCDGSAPQLPDNCGGMSTATCVNGQWVAPYVGCNPPPPAPLQDCPALAPDVDSSCAEYASNLVCSYGPTCGPEGATRRCDPDTALWVGGGGAACNPPALACPSSVPPAGSDCDPEGQQCNYPMGSSCNATTMATCKFGQWVVGISSACNPPAVLPVCPERERSVGDGCAYETQECSYEACTGPSRNGLVCSAGQWQATVLACAGADAGPDSGS